MEQPTSKYEFIHKRMDIIIFVIVLLYLITAQIYEHNKHKELENTNNSETKTLAISNLDEVCIENTTSISTCIDVPKGNYKIQLLVNSQENNHSVLVTNEKGN